MRLAHKDYQFIIRISEGTIPILVLESPNIYRKHIYELCQQCNGLQGGFVLSRDWEPLEIARTAIIITDMFHIELNGRRQLTALQKSINAVAGLPQFIAETNTIRQAIDTWLMLLENEIPYSVVHEDIQAADIIKACNVRFDEIDSSPLGFLNAFIKICASFLNTQLLICVGLHDYLEEEELKLIYKTATYEKVHILDIERHQPEHRLSVEKCYIVDKDLCEIYND